MALLRTFLRAPGKVNLFTLCNNKSLDSCLIGISLWQGVLSRISRHALSTTPRAAAAVSTEYRRYHILQQDLEISVNSPCDLLNSVKITGSLFLYNFGRQI